MLIANRNACNIIVVVPVFQDLLQEILELQVDDVFSQSDRITLNKKLTQL